MMSFEILEKEFASYIGVKSCAVVNTGTAALHIALEALELLPQSEVIVPQNTMVATAWAVHYAGLRPIFVDCCDNLLIDINKIENKINKNTRVIMLTHVYGRVVNMSKVVKLAKKYNLRIIEDAAEAHGCTHSGKMVGSFDIGCFSFYRNKIICGEEGGAVVSNDEEFLEKVRDMRSMSFGKEHNYMHKRIGFNYRMTNSQAEMILRSLSEVEKNIKIRKNNELLYNSLINEKYHMPERQVPWVYDVKVDDNRIVDLLRERGISARYGFKPVGTCAPFNQSAAGTKALKLSKKIMYFPLMLEDKKIIKIVDQFKKIL
mgnify:CR=1 FL=1